MKIDESGLVQFEESLAKLREEISRLSQRVEAIERRSVPSAANESIAPQKMLAKGSLAGANGESSGVSEEVIMAIGAALAAYFGLRPHIRQIRLITNQPWGLQGRVIIQASHALAMHSS